MDSPNADIKTRKLWKKGMHQGAHIGSSGPLHTLARATLSMLARRAAEQEAVRPEAQPASDREVASSSSAAAAAPAASGDQSSLVDVIA